MCLSMFRGKAALACTLAWWLVTPAVGQELTNPSAKQFDLETTSWVDDEQFSLTDCCDCELSCGADGCCDDCGPDCGDGCGCGEGVGCGSGVKKKDKPTCAGSHKGLFYANDFSYLNDPCYKGSCLGDCLKLMPVAGGDWGTLDIGGQLRLRYHHEEGMGRQAGVSGFDNTTNDFMLTRLRLYQNWKLNDRIRIYSEGIFADVLANDEYLPRPIDRNSADFLNLFVDVKVTDNASIRVGRQELLFGDQRLVSPLDWANTRRTFEGIRGTVKAGDWTIDPFYTNFVPVAADDFDEADYDQSFYGCYATRTFAEGANTIDMYYLGFDNQTAGTPVATDFSLHTVGGRLNGKFEGAPVLFDLEGAYQGGRQSGLGVDHSAAFCTCGLGHQFGGLAWKPTVWCYYDYASGNVPGGDFNRFNQLFPLAHKYLGFIDAVARSNVSSPNCLITMAPSKKVNFLFWYYYLGANQAEDIIPGVAVPSNQNTNSKDFGNELDFIAKYTIGPRSNLLLGYSHLWRGDKIIGNSDAQFIYTQWEMNF